MRKKFFAVALTATMVVSSAFTASAEDVDCTGWWVAHSTGYEIDEDVLKLTFRNTTYETAACNWNTPIYVVYEGDEGKVNGEGYHELFVCRSDAYGWTSVGADVLVDAEGLPRTANTADSAEVLAEYGYAWEVEGLPANWSEWLAVNKAGVDCTLTATKDGNKVTIVYTNNGLISTATIPCDASKTVYVSITGELCKITDLEGVRTPVDGAVKPSDTYPPVTVNPSEEATDPSEEATDPSEEATDPSKEVTDPSEEVTDPSEEATDPSEEATNPSEDSNDFDITDADAANVQKDIVVTGLPANVTLRVASIEKSSDNYQAIEKFVDEKLKGKNVAAADLSLMEGDAAYAEQPDGKVKVTLPLFENIKDAKWIQVYRYDDTAKDFITVDTAVEVKDGKFTFETDHFSTYLFASVAAPEAESTTEPEATTTGKTVTDTSSKPKTGDSAPIAVFAGMAAAGLAVFAVSKKRKNA